ncbi:MAG: alpha-ketoglutarate-dependent dioxygenase AlkB [Agriterribacter sp.]
MDLFNTKTIENILPCDGVTIYYGKVFNQQEADHYFDMLWKSIEWKNDETIIFGKHIITKRKTAWYGDSDYAYTYSNITKHALPWTPELLDLKIRTKKITGEQFNSCLLNLYHDGNEGMSWHSDDENTIAKHSSIASISFGAERNFKLKHKKNGHIISLLLENGSLLEMKGSTQNYWLHSIPKSAKVRKPRINLTFRTFI